MFVGDKRQYDKQGRLLGKCEHCGALVTQDHFDADPQTFVNDYGSTVTVGNPRCLGSEITDRGFNRSTGNSSLYA